MKGRYVIRGSEIVKIFDDGHAVFYELKRDVAGGWYWALGRKMLLVEGTKIRRELDALKTEPELPKAAHFRKEKYLADMAAQGRSKRQ